jgi:hypothetical protein
MRLIAKSCVKIQHLDISGCDSLDQGILKHISKLTELRNLIMSNYQQPLGDIQCMKSLVNLQYISFESSCILDN